MRKRIISTIIVVGMMIGTIGCTGAAVSEEPVLRTGDTLHAFAAVNPDPENAEGVIVDASVSNILYDSIGSILAEKPDAAAEANTCTDDPGMVPDADTVYDQLGFGYRFIGEILESKLGNVEIQADAAPIKMLSGLDQFTSTASFIIGDGSDEVDEADLFEDVSDEDDEEDPDSMTIDLSDIDLENVEFLSLYNKGVSDPTVAIIQQRLMDLGFMDSAEPTEYYGSMTMAAVKLFQRQNDLKQDGVMGSESIAMLISDDAKSYLVKKGMKGEDIVNIQTRLYELGYLASKSLITGEFGSDTEKAVIDLQTANALAADGMIGAMTLELFYSETVKANILSFGDKSDIIKACQERLKTLGYLTTAPDGFYGNDTLAAVKLFQSKNDLIVDGYLGPTTREILDSTAAVANGLVLGDEGDTVKRVQELLIKYGYMKEGSATGYFGEVTEKAVKAFQRNNGLTADGDVGSKTMAKLTGGSALRAGETRDTGKKDSGDDSGAVDTGEVSSGSVEELLKVAKSKLGCKYVYGAKGPNTFDCSGFVYWCLNQVGVKQSYITSYGWRTVGKYKKITSYSKLKAGDIIVVTGHVGIIAENGKVIDASSSQSKIVHRDLSKWWKDRFICGWRIFD